MSWKVTYFVRYEEEMVLWSSLSSYVKSHAMVYVWVHLQLLPFALGVEEPSPKGLGCFCGLGRDSAMGSKPYDLVLLRGVVSGRATTNKVTVGAGCTDHLSCPKCGHFGEELSEHGM